MHILYVMDCETTNLDEKLGDIIEISFKRLSDDTERTFYLQPVNWEHVQEEAFRINGHKLEDLKRGAFEEDGIIHQYQPADKALVEIEEFLLGDMISAADRIPVGQNVQFDLRYLRELWRRHGQEQTYPFGRMYIDTMQVAFFIDFVKGQTEMNRYNLGSLVSHYGIKKEKAHRSMNDVRMTTDLFRALSDVIKPEVILKATAAEESKAKTKTRSKKKTDTTESSS